MFTAQFAKGNGGVYRYYRCSKKKGTCSQSYVQEKDLSAQLQKRLQTIALCDCHANWMLKKIEKWEREETKQSQSDVQNLAVKTKASEARMEKLVSTYLDGDIPKEVYLKNKDKIMRATLALKQQKKDLGHGRKNWVEPLREWVMDTKQANFLSSSDNLKEIASFVKKVGTNHSVLNKTANFAVPSPFAFVAQRRRFLPLSSSGAPSARPCDVLSTNEVRYCGPYRGRTCYLLIANEAFYQMS